MINPGSLDEQITIRKPVQVQDAYGAPQTTWSEVLTAWADFRELGGSEVTRAGMPVAQMAGLVVIRHTPITLDTTMRVYRPLTSTLWSIDAISALPGRKVGYELRVTNVDRAGATVGDAA